MFCPMVAGHKGYIVLLHFTRTLNHMECNQTSDGTSSYPLPLFASPFPPAFIDPGQQEYARIYMLLETNAKLKSVSKLAVLLSCLRSTNMKSL